LKSINEFEQIVDHLYGVYLDSTTGFDKLREWLIETQSKTIDEFKVSHPELANLEYLDSVEFVYGKGKPTDPDAIKLHSCTQKNLKERNLNDGINFQFLGNMTLVSIYQYWEDHHRKNISEELGIEKNDLKHPVMGDIRLLRRSIIHHAGIALKDVEKCEIFTWFKENDFIYIDENKFEEMVLKIKEMLNTMRSINA